MNPVISVEHLSKQYDLGVIGTGTLNRDLNRWWARVRKQSDPYTRIGQKDAFERIGETILALDDISFTVQQGEALGIIGSNGAGKSTLLKILSRVTAPTSGVVKVKGRIGSLLEVGTGFHPDLTGRENVYLNGAILGMKKSEVARKFDEIVAFSGVEKFIDTPVKRYSSGMYVRLAFAVAAHLDPNILIVDEVLAVGDAEFQKKCLGKMGDVANEGRTVLFVSHNLPSINFLCNKGILLENGKLLLYDNIDNVINKYLDFSQGPEGLVKLDQCPVISPSITSVSILNNSGLLTNSVLMSEAFTILTTYSSNYPLTNPELGIRINTHNGVSVLGITNVMFQAKKQVDANTGLDGYFKVTFPNPCLNQGDYFVTLTLSDNGITIKKYRDVIRLTIKPKDVFLSGRILNMNQSLLITDAIWEIR